MSVRTGLYTKRYKRQRVNKRLGNLNIIEGEPNELLEAEVDEVQVDEQNVLVAVACEQNDEARDNDEFMSCISDNDFVDRVRDFENIDDSEESDNTSDNEDERQIVENIIAFIDDGNDDGECESVPDEGSRLRRLLAEWAILYSICHNAVDALLALLRLFVWGSTLPKTARTLLKTPRLVTVEPVPPGEYHHFGLLNSLKDFFSKNPSYIIPPLIKISVGSDGLPLSKSSQRDCWPIVGMIPCEGAPFMFTLGVYVGPEKPKEFNVFYRRFVDEAKELNVTGFEWRGNIHKVKINRMHFDAPARSSSLYIKQFNAYFGCGKCEQEGDWEGKVVFTENGARLRTDQSFRDKTQEEHHTGTSILEELDINIVDDIPVDPMHLVYLGVMRKMIHLWLVDGPLSVRMVSRTFNAICDALVQLTDWIPREFSRKSRSLKFLKRFKATEFRQFLLYTGPVVLKGNMPDRLYKNFLLLHVSVRILCHKELCFKFNGYAKSLLDFFVQDFKNLFGGKYVTYNVHNLVHLADEVIRCGPLESFSCFPFENYLHTIKRLIRKGNQHLQQIVKRIMEFNKILVIRRKNSRSPNAKCFRDQHHSGPIYNLAHCRQFKTLLYGPSYFSVKFSRDSCAFLDDGSIIVIENFAVEKGNEWVIGREYINKEDLYSYPIKSSKLEIFSVQELSELRCWPLEKIKKKGLKLPLDTSDEDSFKYAVFPLFMQEF